MSGAPQSFAHDFTPHIVPRVVLAHAEDAAFLWGQRAERCSRNIEKHTERVRFDMRLDAHLDGLRIAGSPGYDICLEEVASTGAPQTVFAAACLAFHADSSRRFEQLFSVAELQEGGHKAVISASAFDGSSAARARLWIWAQSREPVLCFIGLGGLCIERAATIELIGGLLESDHVEIRRTACRAVAEHGFYSLTPLLRERLHDRVPGIRHESARALARFQDRSSEVVDVLLAECESTDGRCEQAADALTRLHIADARMWFDQFLAKETMRRLAVRVAEVSGETSLVHELARLTVEPPLARRAGEALQTILDADLAFLDLEAAEPPELASVPNDDPDDERVELDTDDGLPWPDCEAVSRYVAGLQLPPGTRHLAGKGIGRSDALSARADAVRLLEIVQRARARQRLFAASELAVRSVELPRIEPRAPLLPERVIPGLTPWLGAAESGRAVS